jgi:CubicO group peptidase (beta-lactamase class C family)
VNQRFNPAQASLMCWPFRVLLCLCLVGLCVSGCGTVPVVQRETSAVPASSGPTVRSLSSSGEAPQDIGGILAPIFARAKIPGGAAIVLRGDRIIARGFTGVRKAGAAEAITIDDQFEICSGAKSMAATLVALLVEEGKLSWDTTLAEIFGDAIPGLHPAWKKITVRQVLEHRAGLEDHVLVLARTILWAGGDVSVLRRKLAEKILSRPPDFAPGTKFSYDSTGYLLLGAALEKITGRTWEELMRERLFQPLGLTSGGFGPPGTPGMVDQPWGHGARWLFYLPLPGARDLPFDPGSRHADFPAVGRPAGLVHMSLGDWAKFVSVHLRGDPANPHREVALLKPETFALLHGTGTGEEYAGGWFTGTRKWAKGVRPGDSGRVFFHQGDNGRWNCVVWVAPEIDFAVLIACNRAYMWGPVDEVASALVKAFVATPPASADGE